MSKKRIGVLTSGGDCPGLNAVIRAVVLAADKKGWSTVGFSDGYEGLLSPVRYREITANSTEGIMHLGGTILGTTNRGRFVAKVQHGNKARIPDEIIDEAMATIKGVGVDALVCIGGDGSLSTSLQLFESGIGVVGVPKTIDNDLSATSMTFGFDSAVACVVDAMDRLHTTAISHKRVMVVEVMGRYAGWIALYGGLAGGADAILIPEIPYNPQVLTDLIKQREANGHFSTMVVVAEGARENGKDFMTISSQARAGEARLGGIGEYVSHHIAESTGKETRHVVLGHLQRGGAPTALDRILGTRFGVEAVELIDQGKLGHMVSYHDNRIGSVPIEEAVSKIRLVEPDDQMVHGCRKIGICFGDTLPL